MSSRKLEQKIVLDVGHLMFYEELVLFSDKFWLCRLSSML